MPARLLREYLDQHNTRYVTIRHSLAYTSQEIAASAHIPGSKFAKTVMVKVDGKMAMAVLPASYWVDLDGLKRAVGGRRIELATEREFEDRFPGCDAGAMPPFGNLYDMDVSADDDLATEPDIVFNAGTHQELIRMTYADFERLVRPTVASFCSRAMAAA